MGESELALKDLVPASSDRADEGAGVIYDIAPGPVYWVMPWGGTMLSLVASALFLVAMIPGVPIPLLAETLSYTHPVVRAFTASVAALVGALAVLSLLVHWRGARTERAVRLTDGAANAGDVAARLREPMVGFRRLSSAWRMRRLATELARSPLRGITLRVCRPGEAKAVIPFDAPFEPLPLDETDASVRAMLETRALSRMTEGPRRGEINAPGGRDVGATRARLRRAERLGSGIVRKAGAVLLVLFAVLAVQGPRVRLAAVIPLCVAAIIILPVAWRYWFAVRAARRCLVVPGGLVDLGGTRAEDGSRAHLFDRRRSVLIVRRTATASYWEAVVADEARCVGFVATPAETMFLLRAWTSPLPPPTAEMVRGLGE